MFSFKKKETPPPFAPVYKDPVPVRVIKDDYKDNLSDPGIYDKNWVIMPNGQLGVIDHKKEDGMVAVRPVDLDTMRYLPNKADHWTDEQRAHIPHEISVHPDLLRKAPEAAVPKRKAA